MERKEREILYPVLGLLILIGGAATVVQVARTASILYDSAPAPSGALILPRTTGSSPAPEPSPVALLPARFVCAYGDCVRVDPAALTGPLSDLPSCTSDEQC